MYANAQGEGLFLVLKFGADDGLDTGSHTGAYHHKGACRSYNTVGMAKRQRTRYRNDGYSARIAEVTVTDGVPSIAWVEV